MISRTFVRPFAEKPRIARWPQARKWVCRTSDGVTGIGKTPRAAYLSWRRELERC